MSECKKEAVRLNVFPSCGTIGEAEVSDVVCILQMILNALKVRYDCYDFLEPNGTMDAPTCEAIRSFRTMHDLPDTPGVDMDTWNALASEYSMLKDME